MERRKFVIGAGALATGSAAAVGSGAFTSVEADRSLEVETVGDANALLGIDEVSDSSNSEYVSTTGDTVSIDISTDDGDGLNRDALTKILDLLEITNQGTQDVYVFAQGLPDGVRLAVQNDDSTFQNNEEEYTDTDPSTSPNTGAFSAGSNIDPENPEGDIGGAGGEEGVPVLGPGDNIVIELFSFGDEDVDFDDTIEIVAETTENF